MDQINWKKHPPGNKHAIESYRKEVLPQELILFC